MILSMCCWTFSDWVSMQRRFDISLFCTNWFASIYEALVSVHYWTYSIVEASLLEVIEYFVHVYFILDDTTHIIIKDYFDLTVLRKFDNLSELMCASLFNGLHQLFCILDVRLSVLNTLNLNSKIFVVVK